MEIGSSVELTPLSPHLAEVVFSVAALVAVLFAAYAIRKMAIRQWPVGFGLTLILLTFVVPFGGPVLLAALKLRSVVRSRKGVARV